jgi:hypothetical protein
MRTVTRVADGTVRYGGSRSTAIYRELCKAVPHTASRQDQMRIQWRAPTLARARAGVSLPVDGRG